MARLAGGADALAERALAVAESGDLRLAAQLAEWATQADPHDRAAHAARADIYTRRRGEETSLMAKSIFRSAADDSRSIFD